jgi:hypothetical protein
MADDFDFDVTQVGSVPEFVKNAATRLESAIDKTMLLAATLSVGSVQQSVYETFKPGTSKLFRSYYPTLLEDGPEGEKRSGAVSDLIYARIQDIGGLVTPKKARVLAIPVSVEAKGRAAGSEMGPVEFGKTVKKLHLVWPPGWKYGHLKDSDGKTHYILSRGEYIPPTHYLDLAAAKAAPLIKELIDAEITKSLKDTKAGGE